MTAVNFKFFWNVAEMRDWTALLNSVSRNSLSPIRRNAIKLN